MDDDKKLPPGLDDSFDEHELDLNTPEDLEAIEDITFADTSAESMAIFDEFDDLDDFDDLGKKPVEEVPMHRADDEISTGDLGYRPENTATELLEQDPFSFKEEKFAQNLEKDEDMFASNAFEDVDASLSDFPEGESSSDMGSSQLFDYDPSKASTESYEPEDIYEDVNAGAPMGAAGQGSGGGKSVFKSRRVIRIVLLVVLAGAIYAVLRVFTGSNATTMELTNATPVGAPPAVATSPTENAPEATTEAAPEAAPAASAETPEATAPTTEAPTAAPASVVDNTQAPTEGSAPVAAPAPVPATSAPAAAAPVVPAPATAAPQTSLVVPAQTTELTNKLNSLEASLHAIDDRLSHLAPGAAPKPAGAGMKAPEASHVDDQALVEALKKLNGIDRKISHLSELQTQIQMLNKEVNALKSDVVQQSMIVGQSQAQINQNMAANIDNHAPKMFVQAAIPGRAWLRSETGQLLTVIPGDEVAGYGRVVTIDASTGTVVMSTRAVFREQ